MKDYADTAKAQALMGDPSSVTYALLAVCHRLDKLTDTLADTLDAKPCDDRTCIDRGHWAPMGRITHGSTPTTCVHGQDHPDSLTCVHVREPQASSLETGSPVRVTVTNRKTGAILFDGDMAKLPAGLDLPQGGWSAGDLVMPVADPLDEDDHRPRHSGNDEHLWRHGPEHWHSFPVEEGLCPSDRCRLTLDVWRESAPPLTFCDCDATIEAENGATD